MMATPGFLVLCIESEEDEREHAFLLALFWEINESAEDFAAATDDFLTGRRVPVQVKS